MSVELSQEKKRLRRQLRRQRRALTDVAWQGACDRISTHIAGTALYQQAHTVLAYISHRREPSLMPLWQQDAQTLTPHRWGFPRCVGPHLTWHVCAPLNPEDFQVGAYNIPEPVVHAPRLDAVDVDLILVPSIACDRNGIRLGYGGGFYDRLFADPAWHAIPTIGITFAFADLPQLPKDPWDRPLDGVCTEQGYAPRPQ